MTEKDISLDRLETKHFQLVRDYKQLLKDVATKKEIDKLATAVDKTAFETMLFGMIPAFLKRANWIKWKKYFDMWANAQDKAKLKQMTDSNQINQAYYFLQHKFASSLESLAIYAQGAIVAKILLNLPVPDMSRVSKVSPALQFIVDRFHLKERRKNMGLLMAFSKPQHQLFESRIILSCISNGLFICVEDTNKVHFCGLDTNVEFLYSHIHTTPISKVFCGISEAAVLDETNMLQIFIETPFRASCTVAKFQFSELVTHVAFQPGPNIMATAQQCYVTTNSGIYEAFYRDSAKSKLKLVTPEKHPLFFNRGKRCLHVAFTQFASFYVFQQEKYLDGKVKYPIIMHYWKENYLSTVDDPVIDFWTDFDTFFIKTTKSVYYWVSGKQETWLTNLQDLLPKNFNRFSEIKRARIDYRDDDDISVFLLFKNGTIEKYKFGQDNFIITETNVIDTNFKNALVYWKPDDPKWPLIASQCVSCGIKASDMFGCGGSGCSAVYCSEQCALLDWSNGHANHCK